MVRGEFPWFRSQKLAHGAILGWQHIRSVIPLEKERDAIHLIFRKPSPCARYFIAQAQRHSGCLQGSQTLVLKWRRAMIVLASALSLY